jgi:hypothetical protein
MKVIMKLVFVFNIFLFLKLLLIFRNNREKQKATGNKSMGSTTGG